MYSRKLLPKLIAIVLSLVFLFPVLPSPVFVGTEDPVDPTVGEGIVTETGDGESAESENAEPSDAEEPYIIGEISALREESVKQYRRATDSCLRLYTRNRYTLSGTGNGRI